jgi:hypothetical protein
MPRLGRRELQHQYDLESGGRKHLLEMNSKCLSLFVVAFGPAPVRISEWRDQYLGSFESLRSLP